MADSVEYDPAVLVSGTVGSITEKLGALSLAQLDQLLALEQGGSARPTLVSAIHAELEKRAAVAPPSTAKTYSQDELDSIIAAKEAQWQRDMDAVKAEAARAKAKAAKGDAKPARKVQPLAVAADAPSHLVAIDGVTAIVFVDDTDTPVAESVVPMLHAYRGAFEVSGTGLVFLEPIEFPIHGTGIEIAGAFLLDDEGDPVAKASLAVPFRIGGGMPTKLAARSLYFARPAA